MYIKRVLIVDDEKFIRRGLKLILEQMDYDFSIIQTCRNGREALEKLNSEDFDLVLTDIRMPQIDGIDLIREIQKLKNKPEVIIISGYDEFSYAVEGLKYGAQGYILKPIDKTELKKALDKVEKSMEGKEMIREKNQRLQAYMDQMFANELNYILMNKHLENETIKSMLEVMKLSIFDAPFCVGLLEVRTVETEKLKKCIQDIINNYMKDELSDSVFFTDKNGFIVLLIPREQYANVLLGLIDESMGVKCFLGVSQMSQSMTDIRKLYLESFSALRYRIFKRESSILFYEDIKYNKVLSNIPVEKIKRLSNMLGVQSMAHIKSLLREIFDKDKIYSQDITYLEEIATHMYNILIIDFYKQIPQKSLKVRGRYEKLENIYNFEHVDEYIREWEAYLRNIDEYLKALQETYANNNQIDMAIEFIQSNYYKDLNMAYMANYVSFNYSYFSQAFSKYTGKCFSDYLKEVRIEKAKELLENTDDKIIDISRQVGFQNPKHFMKSFKEITGITPTKYREKARI